MPEATVQRNKFLSMFLDSPSTDSGAGKMLSEMILETSINLSRTITWQADLSCEEARRFVNRSQALARGWDSYDADPPSAEVAELTRQFLELIRNNYFAPPHMVASAEGGLAAAFSLNDRFAQIEFLNSGSVLATMFSATSPPEVDSVEPDEESLNLALETVRNFLLR